MRFDDAEDFARFVEELNRETDRGLPLVGAALIDEKLLETLQSFFIDDNSSKKLLTEGNAPLGTFSSRIEACSALGLIDESEHQEISLIRKVRNEFAHAKHGTSFETEKIRGFCSGLKSDLPDDPNLPTKNPRFIFTNAIVCIVLRLFYRPDWVAKERRLPKTWVPADTIRWRPGKPPEGELWLAIAKRKKE